MAGCRSVLPGLLLSSITETRYCIASSCGSGPPRGWPLIRTTNATAPIRHRPREIFQIRRSGLGDLAAEGLPGDRLRLGTAAEAGVEGVDRGELVGGQLEVEDVEVLRDAGRRHGLRDHLPALLHVPAQHDLRRGPAVGGGDLPDHRVLQRAAPA